MLRSFPAFHDQQRDRVVKQVEDLVFASVIAGLAVAAVQGFLGGLGFWLVGVRAPAVWGTVMAFMSLVPLVGSSIVWAPVALWFLFTGDITRGLVLIGIGGGLVGMADNILRPLLLSGRSSMNGLVTFVALLGDVGLRADRAGVRARRRRHRHGAAQRLPPARAGDATEPPKAKGAGLETPAPFVAVVQARPAARSLKPV